MVSWIILESRESLKFAKNLGSCFNSKLFLFSRGFYINYTSPRRYIYPYLEILQIANFPRDQPRFLFFQNVWIFRNSPKGLWPLTIQKPAKICWDRKWPPGFFFFWKFIHLERKNSLPSAVLSTSFREKILKRSNIILFCAYNEASALFWWAG